MKITLASCVRHFASIVKYAGLADHAKSELDRAGLFDKDSDYEGMVGKAVLELCKLFAKQGHSGFSANWVLDLFNRLGKFKTLTPITADPKEWMDISERGGKGSPKIWQNKRNPAIFSENGGKTWYDVEDKKRLKNKSVNHKLKRKKKSS